METTKDDESLLSVETPLSQDTRLSFSETTPLIQKEDSKEDDKIRESEGVSSANTSVGDQSSDIFDADHELEKPWPATFERSISLLAGPTMDASFIEKATKSPKITPNLSARRKNASYLTPDTQRHISPNYEFRQEINKVQSLDFGKFDPNRRAMEAKLYRQKLLDEARKKKQPVEKDIEKGKEQKKKKKKKNKHGGHGSISDDKASFGQCTFNMANILMGVGMLGLPFIFKSAGWIGGFFVTLIFSSVAWRTSILLGREMNGDPRPRWMFENDDISISAQTPRMSKPISSFPGIAREAFGQTGNIVLSFVLYFELFSCLCIFFVTLGDHLHTLFPQVSVAAHMTHISFALAVPTALLRTPRLLSYLSAVGTFATACVVFSVLGSAIYSGDISEDIAFEKGMDVPKTHILWNTSGLPVAFGLIAYTFSGHAIIPSIYNSMARPQDYESMISFTFIAVSFCCLIVAVSGYFMFGSMVDDQITLSLEEHSGSHNIMMMILTWLMILTAFSKFTLTAFPLALGLEEIIAPVVPTDYVMEW
eukprot:CAMPEP_0203658336 /NCGR_PEP_ID=MMETSP0088-20131115/48030_1 /ASSEMBLY_ACC=CAM_ASM_001087 /TAXON_ID=426623 /ORGANISM="Chaetoceros affinis, Strain CCMP159" /LENGTH=536 /DNA_ID=CAMNT_0050519981 /DNA_START=67 /DNA_END=1674 /DNA_ORIENTATION=+